MPAGDTNIEPARSAPPALAEGEPKRGASGAQQPELATEAMASDLLTRIGELLYAEPLPEGFGFSDTAFRVMASRRLKSDRFFTDDYRPEVYTEFGIEYVPANSMLTVLARHYPHLAPALAGVQNAFQPWRAV